MTMRSGVLAVLCLVAAFEGAQAQSVTDGTEAAIGPDATRAVLALIARQLRSPDAKVSGLHEGRAGAVCGAVDVRNRMGAYTGPRGFVSKPEEGFFGRMPEGPELRSPASMEDFRAMERAKALFHDNCMIP